MKNTHQIRIYHTIDEINEAYIKIMAINILRAAAVVMVETLSYAPMEICIIQIIYVLCITF